MKFWQKRKAFDVTETDQVYKVIYLGNVVTSWAKGEHTLEKPLTALWRNYCNNYANYNVKNGDSKRRQPQNKQILMKLTICNQGLKALTREFGLTEYWANRITFCGQNSNFPRVFAWIYRHEAKQKKQELRVHACFVNSQSNVNKMISTLQQKVNFALNEFKREKRLRENARRILSMNESLNLDDEIIEDKTDSEFFNEFVGRLYNKMNEESGASKLKDDISLNSSERLNFESTNTSKNSTLDSKHITRNPSQGSLNSIKSKSSTSSKKSANYDGNLMSARRQFLIKGLKNFKEPIERSRSAPKLSSISEEFLSSDEDENFDQRDYFNKLLTNNNFVNYYNICEEEPDDEEIIRELGLTTPEMHEDDIIGDNDKTLTEFNENLDKNCDQQKHSVIFENNTNEKLNHPNHDNPLNLNYSDTLQTSTQNVNLFSETNGLINDTLTLCNSKSDCSVSGSPESRVYEQNKQEILSDRFHNIKFNNRLFNNKELNNCKKSERFNKSLKNQSISETSEQIDQSRNHLYDSCQIPSFIIFKKTNSFNNRECNLQAQIVENCKLIEDLVLNF